MDCCDAMKCHVDGLGVLLLFLMYTGHILSISLLINTADVSDSAADSQALADTNVFCQVTVQVCHL